MKIACVSGKGGAGKTLTAVNLAYAAGACTYIDCDVEEPNGRLFLKSENVRTQTVSTRLPAFDKEKCVGCKRCVDFCRFHALVYIKDAPMVFAEVCHSCGGCAMVCPEGAIFEKDNPVGVLEMSTYKDIRVVTGILDPGQASGVPVIREALRHAEGTTVIDCPPGSACSVMECVADADYCLLVAEPTAFGFHNFQMVLRLATLLKKPVGVILNKCAEPYAPMEAFLKENRLCVLARIPYDRQLASLSAAGRIAAEEDEAMLGVFTEVLGRIGGAV